MGSIPLPQLDIRPPVVPNALDQQTKALQLAALTQRMQTENLQQQQMRRQLSDQDALTKAFASYDPQKNTPDDIPHLISQNGGSGNAVMAAQQHLLQLRDTASQIAQRDAATGASNIDTYVKRHDAAAGEIQSHIDNDNDAALGDGLRTSITNLSKQGFLRPDEVQHGLQLAGLADSNPQAARAQLPAYVNAFKSEKQVFEEAKMQSEISQANAKAALDRAEAAQKGSPLTMMETNPGQMAGDKLPSAIGYLQSKISDPTTSSDDKARATRLLNTAKLTQQNQLAFEQQKKAADQAIADGDPLAAGKLLHDGVVSPSQIISSRKPEFAQKAFSAAASYGDGWNAQKAEADFKVAGSSGNVAFFGSAKSLTDKGGTLDQLADAAKDIPGGKIPVFNSIGDAMLAATGSGPVAKYASILLGVADDYSKVMGGGQGSDTSRTQALHLVPTNASPEARAAAIEGIRGAVGSQIQSRIGNNRVLQQMYGGQGTNAPSPAGSGHIIRIGQNRYQYKGSGDTADLANYTELK